MNLPGLLVEYLINGCIALVWISSFEVDGIISNLTDAEKLLLIPIAYVLGMFIDFVAWYFTQPIKAIIRKDSLGVIKKEMTKRGKEFDADKYKLFWDEKVEIEKSHTDLNQELKSRSSRDRIARGTVFNLIAISICYWSYLNWIGIALIVVSFLMWGKFEHYNRCYEIRAAISIRKELETKSSKKHGHTTRRLAKS